MPWFIKLHDNYQAGFVCGNHFFFCFQRKYTDEHLIPFLLIHFCTFQLSKNKLVPERSDEIGQEPTTTIIIIVIELVMYPGSHKHVAQKK